MSLPIAEFDKWFSLYVRIKDADWKGFNYCYTCGQRSWWRYLENGHLFSRKNKSVQFEPDDTRPQCNRCNCFLGGNLIIFRDKLEKELGKERVEELENLSKQIKKWSQSEMREQIEYYKGEVKRIAKEKGIRI